jgi:hypothetical protein
MKASPFQSVNHKSNNQLYKKYLCNRHLCNNNMYKSLHMCTFPSLPNHRL